jgi:hypothetical protein
MQTSRDIILYLQAVFLKNYHVYLQCQMWSFRLECMDVVTGGRNWLNNSNKHTLEQKSEAGAKKVNTCYGFDEKSLTWMHSFLIMRKQFVQLVRVDDESQTQTFTQSEAQSGKISLSVCQNCEPSVRHGFDSGRCVCSFALVAKSLRSASEWNSMQHWGLVIGIWEIYGAICVDDGSPQ